MLAITCMLHSATSITKNYNIEFKLFSIACSNVQYFPVFVHISWFSSYCDIVIHSNTSENSMRRLMNPDYLLVSNNNMYIVTLVNYYSVCVYTMVPQSAEVRNFLATLVAGR